MTTPAKRTTESSADRDAFENAITSNMSPEGIAAVVALLQIAGNYRKDTPENNRAIDEAIWLRDTLLEMIGVKEFNELVDEIGL